MNKFVSVTLAAAIAAGAFAGTASIAAADGMKKDGSFQVAAEMKDKKMGKDAAMKKDEMAKDAMDKGKKMKDDHMAKDDKMKKDMKN